MLEPLGAITSGSQFLEPDGKILFVGIISAGYGTRTLSNNGFCVQACFLTTSPILRTRQQ